MSPAETNKERQQTKQVILVVTNKEKDPRTGKYDGWIGELQKEADLQGIGVESALLKDLKEKASIYTENPYIVFDATYGAGHNIGLSQALMRCHDIFPGSRVIIVTASPDWRECRKAFYHGAYDYVQKSSTRENLPHVLDRFLRKQ